MSMLLLWEANKHGHRKRKRDVSEELSDQNGQQDDDGAIAEINRFDELSSHRPQLQRSIVDSIKYLSAAWLLRSSNVVNSSESLS